MTVAGTTIPQFGRRLLTVKEVAAFLGIKPKTVYMRYSQWAVENGLRVVRMNGNPKSKPMFWSDEVERMVIEHWEVMSS